MPTRLTGVHCALFAFLLLPAMAHAQSTFGDIRGTTRDPQGLALPNATVILHNTGENTTRTEISDDNADFLFENLKPGTYALTAVKAGFSGSPTTTIELDARQSARVDLALSLASVQESVLGSGYITTDRYRRCDRRRHQGNESVGPDAAQFSGANHQPARRPGLVTERHDR